MGKKKETVLKKSILWVDDYVNCMALLPDRDALEAMGFNIIAIDRVNDFLYFIKNDKRQVDCIIIDMNMSTGNLDMANSFLGTRTGILLYDELQKTRFKDTKVVIYSVYKKEVLGSFGEKDNVVFLSKNLRSSEFAKIISELIK